MAAIPHANVSGVLQKAPASAAVAASPMSHTVLVLLQQTVPYSRCPYPLQSLVHNSSLCSQRRTSFAAAERYSQIEKLHRMHFQHKHGSPFLIIATATKVRC
jgi:hypothetical protein